MCLQFSVANLFKILCTKLYQNWPSFVEDYDKNILAHFFLGHGTYYIAMTVYGTILGNL